MDLSRAAIVLRPRSVTETLDLALRVSTTLAPRSLISLSLCFLGPAFALALGLRYGLGLGWGWVWTLSVLAASALDSPFTLRVSRVIFRDHPTLREVARAYRGVLGRSLGSSMLGLGMIALSSCTGFLLLPWVLVRLSFLREATLLEGYGGGQAWKRASSLASSPGSPSFTIACALLVARLASVVLTEALGQGIVDDLLQLGRPFGSLWDDGGSAYALLGLFVSTPYVACARFLHYLDQRTRSDGWDVQLRMLSLHQRAEAP